MTPDQPSTLKREVWRGTQLERADKSLKLVSGPGGNGMLYALGIVYVLGVLAGLGDLSRWIVGAWLAIAVWTVCAGALAVGGNSSFTTLFDTDQGIVERFVGIGPIGWRTTALLRDVAEIGLDRGAWSRTIWVKGKGFRSQRDHKVELRLCDGRVWSITRRIERGEDEDHDPDIEIAQRRVVAEIARFAGINVAHSAHPSS